MLVMVPLFFILYPLRMPAGVLLIIWFVLQIADIVAQRPRVTGDRLTCAYRKLHRRGAAGPVLQTRRNSVTAIIEWRAS